MVKILIVPSLRLKRDDFCEAIPAGENSSFIFYSLSYQFHMIYMAFICNSACAQERTFSKPTSKNTEIGRFEQSLLIESF